MKRTVMSDQKNIELISVFIIIQRRKLIIIIIKVLRNQFILSFSFFNENNDNNNFNIHRSASIIRSAKNVEFFDLDYKNVNNSVIINADRHIFYRNVYIFENKLKNLTKSFINEQHMRKLISKCLRDETFK